MTVVNHPPKSSSQAYVPKFSPRHLGYRMPAEWEPHAATWLAWPHNEETWPDDMERIYVFHTALTCALAPYEAVHIMVSDESMARDVEARLRFAGCTANYTTHVIPTNDAWCRDYGPTYVIRHDDETSLPKRVGIDWTFNSWGQKYPPCDADNAAAPRMARVLGDMSISGGITLEGGAIDVNGQGTVLTTESCLLHPNRNPDVDRHGMEGKLQSILGASQIIWLGSGLEGDDTDGHVDQLARFVGPNRIALVADDDPASANYQALQENRRLLDAARNANGQPFEIVTLPSPPPSFHDVQRLPTSYANFYVANGCVLVPEFGFATDALAAATLQSLFPARKVIGLDCRFVVRGFGAIHCLTQQVPAV